MPELPEVETVRRQLEPELAGRRIERLEVLDARWCRPVPAKVLERAVSGSTIQRLERRGKYLLLALDGDRTLVMHLRMTGNLVLVDGEAKLDPSEGMRLYEGERSASERHLRARFTLDDGRQVWFTDPRRFGEAFLIDDAELDTRFARLGVEPLSEQFTAEALGGTAAGRVAPLKSFLLDQSHVAGVGNIYADEALFRARLHPLSPAGSMRPEHHEALREAVVAALEAGLEHGGASIDDYLDGRGEPGGMQDEFLVHTREGEPCPSCGGPISRIVVSGRSTYYCPACQVRLRKRRRRALAARDPTPPSGYGARDPTQPSGPPFKLGGMPGTTVKTEAIVLRSIRYGEADRILHLYSAARGRVNAIAKGVRQPRSRFGGRLEPFFRLDLVLHEGRGELLDRHQRRDRRRLSAAALLGGRDRRRRPRLRRGAAPASTRPSRTAPPTTCSAGTWRCSTPRGGGGDRHRDGARLPPQAGARRRVRSGAHVLCPLRRGRAPRAASRGRPAESSARPARRAPSRSPRRPTTSWSRRSPGRSRRRPPAGERELRQVERAVGETLEHHAHVQLRPAA